MAERIAVKRLTESDLSFFQTHFALRPNQRQKAINLNRDILIDRLYPGLAGLGQNLPVDVTFYGPGEAGACPARRPITPARGAQKNWRLNGGTVEDPPGEPGRFGRVQVGDFAIMDFAGDLLPRAISIVLVSAGEDFPLHAGLGGMMRRRSMAQISRTDLRSLVNAAGAGVEHPIHFLLMDDAELELLIEDAVFGSAPAKRRLRQRVGGRKITPAEMAAVRDRMEQTGRDGEALVWAHLQARRNAGEYAEVVWVAETDAAASWDFEVVGHAGEKARIDAKSTRGEPGGMIHVSGAQIAAAADPSIPYRIARVHGIDEHGCTVRLSEGLNELAAAVRDATAHMPQGVLPDGFTIDPKALVWGPDTKIARPEDDPET